MRQDSTPSRRLRLDAGAVSRVRETPQGGLAVEAVLTKPGVFVYYDGQGRPVREYRPPEEVFSEDALATLPNAPVTMRHHGLITTANFREFTAGHVEAGSVRREGDTVVATLIIQDAQTLADIRAGTREVSCGTLWQVDPTPGQTPEGEPYDCVQRSAQYNHVAIEPKARLGSDMRLRLDSAGDQTQERLQMRTIRIDGRDYPIDTPEQLAIAQAALAQSQSALQARLDAAQAGQSAMQARLDAAESSSVVQARVNARVALVGLAVKVDPKLKCDAMDDGAIKRAICGKVFPELKLDGKDEAYVNTLFEAACVQASRSQAREDAAAIRPGAPPVREAAASVLHEDGEEDLVEAARLRAAERRKDAWKKPIGAKA